MLEEDKIDGQRKLIKDFRDKQRNTVWPDPLINSRGVDMFLWKGSPNPTRVQRAGAVVFGLFFMIAGITYASMAVESRSIPLGIMSLGGLYVGVRMLRNSFPRRKGKSL